MEKKLNWKRMMRTVVSAAALATVLVGGVSAGAQASTLSVSPAKAHLPVASVMFYGTAHHDTDYYVSVSRSGDPYPVFIGALDDSDSFATATEGWFMNRFTFTTPKHPDPSGWGDFSIPGTYTATLEPMSDNGISNVSCRTFADGRTVQTQRGIDGSVSCSWTVA